MIDRAGNHYDAGRYNTTPMHLRRTGTIITAALIGYMQKWLLKRNLPSTLVLERQGEKNRVLLRIEYKSSMFVAEVAHLNGLRKRDPQAPLEHILALFCEAS